MKVKTLIKKLSEVDGELPVFVMTDEEGNGSNELSENCIMIALYNEMFEEKMPADEEDVERYDPDDVKKGLFLWP